MKQYRIVPLLLLLSLFIATAYAQPSSPGGTVSVYATGLNNPRGLKFGPDGKLYVAEGGTGGTNSTTGCDQVIPPIGPYTGSQTGSRISVIDSLGVRTTVADNIPSNQNQRRLRGARERRRRCRVEPDGTYYSLINVNGDLYAVEPNHGELDKITTAGSISRVVDISATQGHIVPTAIAFHDGNFYVGNLRTFPIVQGSSKIYRITPAGQITPVVNGLTTVLGVTFDDRGRSRIWTYQPGSQGTVSQSLPTTPPSQLGAAKSAAAGLREDSGFRTNIGVVNLDTQANDFAVGVQGDRKSTSFSVHLLPLSMMQVPLPAGDYGTLRRLPLRSSGCATPAARCDWGSCSDGCRRCFDIPDRVLR